MPRFLWTVILVTIAIFAVFLNFLRTNSPAEQKNLIFFFILLFIFLTLLVSIPTYLIKFKFAPKFAELKTIYRSSLRLALFISSGLCGIGIMKVVGALTLVNLVLYLLFLFAVFKFTSRS